MNSVFARLADWIINHYLISWVLVILLTVFAGIGHYDPYLILPEPAPVVWSNSNAKNEKHEYEEVPEVEVFRVNIGDVIVVAESEEFFSPAGADAIRDAVAALEALPQVYQVLWMDLAPRMNLFGLTEPILPKRHASEKRYQAALKRAQDHPLVNGQLMSPDGNTLLLMVSINYMHVLENGDCTDALRDAATEAVSKYDVQMRFRVTGQVPISLSHQALNRSNEVKYQLIGYSIALVIAFILFRGLSAVIIVAMAPAMGVFWTLGILHYFGLHENEFNSVVVPVLLCMVGFTDGVHMMVQIRKHRAAGASPPDAAKRSIREVGFACWLTSFTTAIGFGSLYLAHHEVVREFGYCCVIGVLTTFLAVITVIPLAASSRLGKRVHTGYGKNLVDKNLERISGLVDFVLRHHRAVGWTGIIGTLVLAAFTLSLRPDERLTSQMDHSSEAAQALAHIDESMGGMETAEISMHFPDVDSDDGRVATVAGEIESLLRAEPKIGHPISIHSLINALPGEGKSSDRMSLLDLLPSSLKYSYYVPERHSAKVVFRLQDIGIAQYDQVFERIETSLEKMEQKHKGFELSLQGGAIRRWKNLYQIVVDLALSLGAATVIIFGVLALVYRSWRIGLISVIPNTFPLAATGFALYASGNNLEIVSVCAFTICLGIAVDDTIHFLTRFYEEDNKEGSDRCNAIRRSFVGVGTALIMTTVVLMIGFGSALMTDTRAFHIFATMGMMTIGCALFADLVFLPALLLRYAPKRKPQAASDNLLNQDGRNIVDDINQG